MCGRVEMRSVMFQHPETAREISVAFDGGIWKCFKSFFIAGPRRKVIVDGVAEINHARAALREARERDGKSVRFRMGWIYLPSMRILVSRKLE